MSGKAWSLAVILGLLVAAGAEARVIKGVMSVTGAEMT